MHLLLPLILLIHSQTPAYSVWSVDSMTKVQLTDLPKTGATGVTIKMARCEAQSFQVAIRPLGNLSGVTVLMDRLVNGTAAIPTSSVSWAVVGVLRSRFGDLPEVLLPVPSFNVPANTTISTLTTIKAPCDAPAGVYKGLLYMIVGTGKAVISVQVVIYPFSIPQAGTPGALSHFSAAWTLADFGDAQEYQRYGDMLLSYRMNPDNIWRNGTPNPDVLEHWYMRGLSGYNLYKADSAYLPAIDAFFMRLAKEPHGAQLKPMAYFFGYDEKSRAYLDTIVRSAASISNAPGTVPLTGARANLKMLRARYPNVPSYSTAHLYVSPWKNPIGDLSNYYLSSIIAERSFYNYADGERVRTNSDTTFSPPRYYGYKSYFGDKAELMASSLNVRGSFWSQFQQKSDGFSYNRTNAWTNVLPSPIPSIDPSAGPIFAYTFVDGTTSNEIIFHGKNGPLASMRMVNICNGYQDYEYLFLFAQKIESVESAREVAEQVTLNWQFPKTSTQVQASRDVIAGYLSQPYLARHPDPPHRSTGVSMPVLSWRSDSDVASFDLYVGDSLTAVQSAGPKSPEYRGRLSSTGFKLSTTSLRAYYWRVDEVINSNVYKGYVWKFTTN